MELHHYTVWKLIDEFSFDGFEGGERFSDRLARSGEWTPGYTLDVIDEYKRFLFLCATQTEVLAPPTFVDMAWMIHISDYPESYRQLCLLIPQHLIRRNNVFVSTKMYKDVWSDNARWFFNNYIRTQKIYAQNFGDPPCVNIWGTYDQEMYPWKAAHLNIRKKMNFPFNYKSIFVLFLMAVFLFFLMYNHPIIMALGVIAALVFYFTQPFAHLGYDTVRDGKGYRQALREDEPTL